MAKWVCDACGYEYDEEAEGKKFADLPDDWTCPVCGVDVIENSITAQAKTCSVK